MGMPAARLLDMTVHGGIITAGFPSVLIGGMPAARLLDMHTCPMATPAPVPVPHVGGPINKGSVGVLIGGMPAARVGDLAVCAGPPDFISSGCMTVLIGETMAGGGGGGGGAGAGTPASVAAHASAATAQTDNIESTTKEEHWADFEFVDKAGNIISGIPYKFKDSDGKETKSVLRQDGHIRRDALGEGQCEAVLYTVSNAKWSKDSAEVGEKVKLSAEVKGFEDGTEATVEIYKRDITGPDVQFETLHLQVKGGKVEAEWEYTVPEGEKEPDQTEEIKYSYPQYYFEVLIEHTKARSGLLGYKDWIEFELKDEEGDAIPDESYILYLSNGETREGKLDKNGHAKEENVPPGECKIKFPNLPYAIFKL